MSPTEADALDLGRVQVEASVFSSLLAVTFLVRLEGTSSPIGLSGTVSKRRERTLTSNRMGVPAVVVATSASSPVLVIPSGSAKVIDRDVVGGFICVLPMGSRRLVM